MDHNQKNKSVDQKADPTLIFELSVGYWRSSVLFSALEIGVFDTIGDQSISVSSLASALDLSERPVRLLIKALEALNLVNIESTAEISNSPDAKAFLCRGQPGYLGDAIQFNARSYPAWGQLTEALRNDQPAMDIRHFLGGDAGATRNFVMAMDARAKGVASCLVEMLDLGNARRLLDVGGGPATYSAMLAVKYPSLECTVLDLPEIVAVAEELMANSPVNSRIRLQRGDMFTTSFDSDFDVVLLSGVLHRTEGDEARTLLRKAANAVLPGGTVVISDLFSGRENPGPVLPELFSIHMMLTSTTGVAHTLDDLRGFCEYADLELTDIIPYPPPLPHSLCLARKKEKDDGEGH